jgi:hypothetical protein
VCTGCDFASSYVLGCLSLYGSWSYNTKQTAPCVYAPCDGNTEEAVIHDVDVSLSVAFDSGTITRSATPGGGCCYSRVGTATVTYSVTIVDKGACCHHSANVCTVTTTLSGSREVDYCHTVTPFCRNGTTCSWRHTTSVCPFYLTVNDVLLELNPADCSNLLEPLDCEELPLERVGIAIGGGRWEWWSEYVALDTLDPVDFKEMNFCTAGVDCVCSHDVVSTRGPFSLYFLADWGATPPADCTIPAEGSHPYYLGSWTNCAGDTVPGLNGCTEGMDFDDTCCTREFNFNANAPCYS